MLVFADLFTVGLAVSISITQEAVDAFKIQRSVAVRAEEHLMEEPAGILGSEGCCEQICGYSALIYEPVSVFLVLLPFDLEVIRPEER